MAELVARLQRARARTSTPATAREIEALVYLCAAPGRVSVVTIGRDLGEDPLLGTAATHKRRGRHVLRRLASSGLLSRWQGTYTLTEAGRIAAALAMLRDPGLKEAFFDV